MWVSYVVAVPVVVLNPYVLLPFVLFIYVCIALKNALTVWLLKLATPGITVGALVDPVNSNFPTHTPAWLFPLNVNPGGV